MHFERGVRFSVVKIYSTATFAQKTVLNAAFMPKANFMENSEGKGDRLRVSVEY